MPVPISLPKRTLAAAALAGLAAAAWAATPRLTAAEPAWKSVSSAAFGAEAQDLRARWATRDQDREAGIAGFVKELDADPRTATRAAVLLGLIARESPAGGADRAAIRGALLQRLESRVAPPSRGETGVDLVAARVVGELLPDGAIGDRAAERLLQLAAGDQPFPDLATRVACATALLDARRDGRAVPFLLAVLRAETPAQGLSPRTWPRITTLAWVKTRASAALSRAVHTEARFRPDGSWEHQVEEASRLEEQARKAGLIGR